MGRVRGCDGGGAVTRRGWGGLEAVTEEGL